MVSGMCGLSSAGVLNNWYKCTMRASILKKGFRGHITTEAVILYQENTVTKSNIVCEGIRKLCYNAACEFL